MSFSSDACLDYPRKRTGTILLDGRGLLDLRGLKNWSPCSVRFKGSSGKEQAQKRKLLGHVGHKLGQKRGDL